MKATTTKRIISTVHAIFFTILLFFVMTIFSLLVWLKNGIFIEEGAFFGLKVAQLYIKWDKKIALHAQSIEKLSDDQTPSTWNATQLNILTKVLYNSIDEIQIQRLHIADFKGSIFYRDKSVRISSTLLDLTTDLNLEKAQLTGENFTFTLHPYALKIWGHLALSPSGKSVAYQMQYQLSSDANGTLSGTYYNKNITLDVTASSVPSIGFLEKFFSIPDHVTPWIFTKLHADRFTLEKLTSKFSLENPKEFLKNLYVNVHAQQAAYLFDDKLFPLQASDATVIFEQQNLTIKPHNPSYADHNLLDAQIDIHGLGIHPKLRVFLHTHGMIDTHVNTILNHYRVALPLVQTQGETNTTFELTIDLPQKQTHWKASIQARDATVLWDGIPLEITQADIKVDDTVLHLQPLAIRYKEILKASAHGSVDLKAQQGSYDLNISHFTLDPFKLIKPYHGELRFTPKEIVLENQASQWAFLEDNNFTIASHTYGYDRNQTWNIDKFHLYEKEIFDATIDGSLNFVQEKYDLKLALNKLQFTNTQGKEIRLTHPIRISHAPKNLKIYTNDAPLELQIGDKNLTIEEIYLENSEDFVFKLGSMRFDTLFAADLNARYQKEQKMGKLTLDPFYFDPDYVDFHQEALNFTIDNRDKPRFYNQDYALGYLKEKGNTHIFYIDELLKLKSKVPLLKQLNTHHGQLKLITRDFKHFNLFATLYNFPIKGYINPNEDQSVIVNGTITPQGYQATINKNILLHYDTQLDITLENTRFDLRTLLQSESNDSATLPELEIDAKMGSLLLTDKNELIYEALHAQLSEKNIYANITHDQGKAILVLEKEHIEIFGEHFNDVFIRSLLGFKGLKGGDYNFFLQGKGQTMQGGVKIHQATAIDFTLYNNLLAYLNTIPALLTFKTPGFDADGFTIKEGDILFTKNGSIIDFKTIKLLGASSNIIGTGSVDTKNNLIDMTLRIFLVKEMGAMISKIPVAGYLLLGDDGSLTTTLSIKGSLDAPKISVELGKDIIMAPINIIKRTINLPSKLLNWITGNP